MFSYTSRTGIRLKLWKMKPIASWRSGVSSLSV